MRSLLIISIPLFLQNCSVDQKSRPIPLISVAKYRFIEDSIEINSIFKTTDQSATQPINYETFNGKILTVSLHNNSKENIYLLKPFQEESKNGRLLQHFSAAVQLVGISNDSINWQQIFNRGVVDTYDPTYDTIQPGTTISKLVYLNSEQRSNYLLLVLDYKSDSLYYNDTIGIARQGK